MSAVKDMTYIMIPVGSSLEYAEMVIAAETAKWFGAETAKVLGVNRAKLHRMKRGAVRKRGRQIADVYCIRDDERNLAKIGISNDPKWRLDDIQRAAGCNLRLVQAIDCGTRAKARRIEARLHEEFSAYRRRGEWFDDSGSVISTAFEQKARALAE